MATTNYNLPTITGNMTADVVRDMNALANATDSAIKQAVDGVDLTQIEVVDQRLTTHLDDETHYLETYCSVSQAIAPGTSTKLGYNTVSKTNPKLYEALSDGSIKILNSGVYEVSLSVQFGINAVGSRSVAIVRKSENALLVRSRQRTMTTTDGTSVELSSQTFFECSANDEIYISVYQTSNVSVDIIGSNDLTLRIRRLGDHN